MLHDKSFDLDSKRFCHSFSSNVRLGIVLIFRIPSACFYGLLFRPRDEVTVVGFLGELVVR